MPSSSDCTRATSPRGSPSMTTASWCAWAAEAGRTPTWSMRNAARRPVRGRRSGPTRPWHGTWVSAACSFFVIDRRYGVVGGLQAADVLLVAVLERRAKPRAASTVSWRRGSPGGHDDARRSRRYSGRSRPPPLNQAPRWCRRRSKTGRSGRGPGSISEKPRRCRRGAAPGSRRASVAGVRPSARISSRLRTVRRVP